MNKINLTHLYFISFAENKNTNFVIKIHQIEKGLLNLLDRLVLVIFGYFSLMREQERNIEKKAQKYCLKLTSKTSLN
jgi:hypothetical protein